MIKLKIKLTYNQYYEYVLYIKKFNDESLELLEVDEFQHFYNLRKMYQTVIIDIIKKNAVRKKMLNLDVNEYYTLNFLHDIKCKQFGDGRNYYYPLPFIISECQRQLTNINHLIYYNEQKNNNRVG